MTEGIEGKTVTAADISRAVGKSAQYISQCRQKGKLRRVNGRYPLDDLTNRAFLLQYGISTAKLVEMLAEDGKAEVSSWQLPDVGDLGSITLEEFVLNPDKYLKMADRQTLVLLYKVFLRITEDAKVIKKYGKERCQQFEDISGLPCRVMDSNIETAVLKLLKEDNMEFKNSVSSETLRHNIKKLLRRKAV